MAGGSGTFAGTIGDYTAAPGSKLALTKTGTGTQTLSGANTYTGATIISGGTLALSGSGTIANTSGLADNGTFDISGLTNGGTTMKTLTGNGVVKLGANLLTLATPDTIAVSISDGGIVPNTGGKVTLSGTGTYVFTGANTYSGATTINTGATLQGTTATLSGNSAIVDNGTLAFVQGGMGGAYAAGVSGTGIVNVSGVGAGSALTFSGALTQTGGFNVTDASTVTLKGSSVGDQITLSGAGATFNNLGMIQVVTALTATAGATINNGDATHTAASIEGVNNASGVITQGAANATVSNYGLIKGDQYSGVGQNSGTGGITVNNYGTGVIYGQGSTANSYGVFNNQNGALTLNNASGGVVVGSQYGVYGQGAATIVMNSGTIASGSYTAPTAGAAYSTGAIAVGGNSGVYLASGGTVANGASIATVAQNTASQIIGGTQAAIYSNAALMLTNYGAISSNGTGTVDAVTIQGTATVINAGTITAATGGASGIAFVGTGSSIVNSGKITGGNNATYGYGLQAAGAAAGSITNQAGGTITASTGGILRASTGAVTIANSGVISGTGTTSDGINATAGTGTITNNTGGFVIGMTDGIDAAGSASISNAGTIGTGTLSGTTLTTAGVYGLKLAGATNAVTNTGTISTGAAGIFVTTGTLALTNTGMISSGNTYGGNTQDGVYVNGTSTILNAGTITNATRTGTIAAPTYSAINAIGASTVTNASAGVLTGGTDATYGEAIQFHAASTFNNYGSATGAGNGAVYQLSNAATVVNLFAGSTTGAITTGAGSDTLTLYNGLGAGNAGLLYDTATSTTSNGSTPTGTQVVLQNAGRLAAAQYGQIDLGGGTNTLVLAGIGDGMGNGDAGTFSLATSTGASILTKIDAGTWTLTGAAITPSLTINAGTGMPAGLLIFDGATGLTGDIYVNGGIVRATGSGAFGSGTIHTIDPEVQFAAGTYGNAISLESTSPSANPTILRAIDASGTNAVVTLSGAITEGMGNPPTGQAVTFSTTADGMGNPYPNTFVLTNTANNWSGATTIDAGVTLQGTAGTTNAPGTISGGSIVDNGVLAYVQDTDGTVAQAISGSGSLVKSGAGTVTLNQYNSYRERSISGGTGQLSTMSPSRSWLVVVVPRVIVPTYSLSSDMSSSEILVPRPSTTIKRPVASGSSVPQWPTFLGVEKAADDGDNVVRGHAGGFIHQQNSVGALGLHHTWEGADYVSRAANLHAKPDFATRNGVEPLRPGDREAVRDDLFVQMGEDAGFHFGQFAAHPRASRQFVAAATVTAANRAHVELWRLGAQADPHQSAFQFLEERRDEHCVDAAQMVDETLVVLGQHAERLRRVHRQREAGHAAFGGEFERIQQRAQQFQPAQGIAVVEFLRNRTDRHAEANQRRADLVGARARLRILERTRVGGDGHEEVRGDVPVHGQVVAGEEFVENLTRRGRVGVNVGKVAVTRIADVVIDVDRQRRLADGLQRRAETRVGGRVQGHEHVKIPGFRRRAADEFRAGQEPQLVEHPVLVPKCHVLAERAQAQTERDGAAQRVAVGPQMADDHETPVRAQGLGDLREAGIMRRHRP